MKCLECSRLSKLFSDAIRRHATLRAMDLSSYKAGDMIMTRTLQDELTLSTAEIGTIRGHLLDHEATHLKRKMAAKIVDTTEGRKQDNPHAT